MASPSSALIAAATASTSSARRAVDLDECTVGISSVSSPTNSRGIVNRNGPRSINASMTQTAAPQPLCFITRPTDLIGDLRDAIE